MPDALTPPIITIDIEDWPQSTWDHALPITQRAADNTYRLLALLDEEGIRTTMFVLGKFAERFPEVVRAIAAQGHEVASHGYGHIEIFDQTPARFAEDVRRSKGLLEDLIGEAVRGYRAPDFSIVEESLWALEILADLGFAYDSSIFPVRRPRYGIPAWPTTPVRVQLDARKTIIEFPIATVAYHGNNWPIGGGGYHRLLPGRVSRWLARRVLAERSFVFYCHPYEFDPAEFREMAPRIPWRVRLHQGLGRRWFERRFRAFVRAFGGRRVVDALSTESYACFVPSTLDGA